MKRRRQRLRPWALGGSLVLSLAVGVTAATLMAILGANVACIGGESALAAPATRIAVREIPPKRLRIYQEAGRALDIDWAFLASIGYQECGHGACASVSSSGCAGPMAIAYVPESPCSPGAGPTIWDRYKTDGDGDGRKSIFDPADAVFTAARILREVLGAPPAGGSYGGYRKAACGYYGACADSLVSYADEVMARAVEYGFRGTGTPASLRRPATEAVAAAGSGTGCAAAATPPAGSEIVRIAQSQLGRAESPRGSNCNPYGPCEEWCSLFVAWVWKRAGVPLEAPTAVYGYSGSIYDWAKAHESGLSLPATSPPGPGESPFSNPLANGSRALPPTATPAPGDAVLYGSGPQASNHIGIVERVFPNGEITTIDGNFSDEVARAGPFLPSQAVAADMPAPIFGYARPPAPEGGENGA